MRASKEAGEGFQFLPLAGLAITQRASRIEVQGWLTSSGQPWINLVNAAGATDVTLYSPMIWPTGTNDAVTLKLKGVKHLQDSEKGTRTELTLCVPQGLGSGTSAVLQQ